MAYNGGPPNYGYDNSYGPPSYGMSQNDQNFYGPNCYPPGAPPDNFHAPPQNGGGYGGPPGYGAGNGYPGGPPPNFGPQGGNYGPSNNFNGPQGGYQNGPPGGYQNGPPGNYGGPPGYGPGNGYPGGPPPNFGPQGGNYGPSNNFNGPPGGYQNGPPGGYQNGPPNAIQPYNNNYGPIDNRQNEHDEGKGIFSKFTKVISHAAGGLLGAEAGGGSGGGIRQLLAAAATEAVKILGIKDGYFTHTIVKILLPGKLSVLGSLASKFGLGSVIDKFILSMNRAAEEAASASLPIFHRFISTVSVNDVACMMSADGNAATQYFKQQTERELEQAYAPIVNTSMNNWHVTRNFNEIQEVTRNIPGARHFNVDIGEYTVKSALHGLFYVLGDQEAKLRKDPTGRIGSLVHQFVK